jgi:hypothetical protein
MAKTYEPIATNTLGSAASSIVFSSIPNTYTDLRIVFVGTSASNIPGEMRFNSDTAANYSRSYLSSNGATVSASRDLNQNYISIGTSAITSTPMMNTVDIFSYAGSVYKTCLITCSDDRNGSGTVDREVATWRSTSAISSITLTVDLGTGTFLTGTTATLYGIKAA